MAARIALRMRASACRLIFTEGERKTNMAASGPEARKIVTCPVGKDGLFVQPKQLGADRELVEGHNRLNFANNFSFADPWTGNTRTYDPQGNYNCGACNKADGKGCLLIPIAISPAAGSCRHWENLCAGDPELKLSEIDTETPEVAAYGVAQNGKGFGCHRCPYASAAIQPDSQGRNLYCGKGDFRTLGNACCQLNGAPVVDGVASQQVASQQAQIAARLRLLAA